MSTDPPTASRSIVWHIARGATVVLSIGFAVLLMWTLWQARTEGVGFGHILLWFVEGWVSIGAFAYLHIRWPWLYGLWACLFLAMVLTPADPTSMLCLLVPLIIVYVLAIWRWTSSRPTTSTAETNSQVAQDKTASR